jgi:hypothetical protein
MDVELSLWHYGENRLTMFEDRVLRRIFGLKRHEIVGGWRKLHNEEVHNLHSLQSIIRMMSRKTI